MFVNLYRMLLTHALALSAKIIFYVTKQTLRTYEYALGETRTHEKYLSRHADNLPSHRGRRHLPWDHALISEWAPMICPTYGQVPDTTVYPTFVRVRAKPAQKQSTYTYTQYHVHYSRPKHQIPPPRCREQKRNSSVSIPGTLGDVYIWCIFRVRKSCVRVLGLVLSCNTRDNHTPSLERFPETGSLNQGGSGGHSYHAWP